MGEKGIGLIQVTDESRENRIGFVIGYVQNIQTGNGKCRAARHGRYNSRKGDASGLPDRKKKRLQKRDLSF